jgi:xanthine/CO dehydrogenase XdhC/CoxF family maturation factor
MRLRVVDRRPGSNRLLIRADNESGWYLMSCCGGEVSVIHNECKYVDQLEIRQKVILQFVNLHGFLWLVVFINRHVRSVRSHHSHQRQGS